MPVCAAGSERRPESPEFIVIDPLYMRSLLTPGLQWLFDYLPYIEPIYLEVDAFCAVDPPSYELPAAAELAAMLLRTPYALALSGALKVAQIVTHWAWYTLCQCTDLEVVSPPTAPSAPTGSPTPNPPGVVQPPAGLPCAITNFEYTHPVGGSTGRVDAAIPAGVTGVQLVETISENTNTGPGTGRVFLWMNAALSVVGSITSWHSSGGSQSVFGTKPATAVNYSWQVTQGGTQNEPGHYQGTANWYCGGGTPDSPVSNPCVPCPPDPYLVGLLGQIMAELRATRLQADLIQRQAIPFATIDGDSHLGLTGEGEIEVFGLVGVRVGLVDTLEGTVSVVAGNPETLYNTGWIRWGDDSGWQPRVFLDSEVTLSTPYAASSFTRIGYSLPPGTEIDIVEVRREA